MVIENLQCTATGPVTRGERVLDMGNAGCERGQISLNARAATAIGAGDREYLRWTAGMLVSCHVVFLQRVD